ncbi:unnamed protein product [Gongylonema pulchrum]|uniref:Uncharacterized protein n=1 Tax=Gongylonema pulchrum TaxID=637853 RepID=A0A183D447_9BILA|nr:unnamed protein product [Gongylonema pulchrum]
MPRVVDEKSQEEQRIFTSTASYQLMVVDQLAACMYLWNWRKQRDIRRSFAEIKKRGIKIRYICIQNMEKEGFKTKTILAQLLRFHYFIDHIWAVLIRCEPTIQWLYFATSYPVQKNTLYLETGSS